MRVRLSSNESPFGPSPQAVEAIRRAATEAHRYPDDASVALRQALAEVEGRPVEEVVVGAGSAAILLDLIGVEHRRTGGAVVAYERGFIMYRLAAQTHGAPYREAPLGEEFRRDPEALIGLVDDRTAVVCIDNPGNPTGRHLDGEELAAVVAAIPEQVTVVVDEAYHHFAAGQDGYRTVAELGLEHPRLVVVRTFSKAYALAGLRVGYATGPVEVLRPLDTARVRFNVSAVAHAAALAALGDRDHLERTIEGTLTGRHRMAEGLRALGVGVVEGLGNFVLVDCAGPARPVADAFAARGVGVRTLEPYGLDRHLRVTVGTPEEVDAFLAAAAEVFGRQR